MSKNSNRKLRFGLDVNPPVFFTSAGFILVFVILTLLFSEQAGTIFEKIQNTIATQAGWFYVLAANIFLAFSVFLLFSRFGRIRLGGPEAKPDFTLWGWFAMLFSAGMGIGLLFWSVAEPMYHYAAPPQPLSEKVEIVSSTPDDGQQDIATTPPVEPSGTISEEVQAAKVKAARQAMRLTFYHWGLHAWGIYAVVGLALAFFAFNRGLPLTLRSAFYPLLKDKIYGPIGDLIDVLAVVATLFGVATSLGLGVTQINGGLSYVFNVPQAKWIQIILIIAITGIATMSVVAGLDGGIRRLSEFNMWVGFLLLLFVLVLGPTLFLLNSLVQNIGEYIQGLPELSFWTEAYQGTAWQDGWTIFYWAWWIAWSPFVGMFIARISRGRTVREFLMGVLFVPTILSFIWLTVFGDAALYEELFGAAGIADLVVNQGEIESALFALLARYPLSLITSILAIIVVVTFFVTSSDSGSLVIDIITAGGNTNPPVKQRIFWAVLEGIVAAALLIGGGLGALQTAVITTGLPFTVVLLALCVSLYKGLSTSYVKLEHRDRQRLKEELEKIDVDKAA